jgi:hypothetical protein
MMDHISVNLSQILYRGVGVEMTTHVFNLQLQLVLSSPVGTLELY